MPTASEVQANKAAQEAESITRAAKGTEPALNAGATDVVDDGPRGDPQEGHTRPATGDQEMPSTPPPRGENPNITKRNEIVARWRVDRAAKADEERDQLSDFLNTGMPLDFEAAAAPTDVDEAVIAEGEQPEIEAEAPPATQPESRPQMVTVKIRGVEKEITLEEALAEAQKSLAGESYLEEGRNKLKEIEALERDFRARISPARAGQDGEHPAVEPSSTQTADGQPSIEAGAPAPGSKLAKLVETLQFGDPAEAETLMASTIAEETAKQVRDILLAQRLKEEGARSQQILKDFVDQHAELAADPFSEAVIQRAVYDLQVEDLKAIGVDPSKIHKPNGQPVTPADVSEAHRYYRSEGLGRTPQVLLDKALEGFLAWKGVGATPSPATPSINKAAPRIEVQVDRTARRAAIPQQPSRTGTPSRAPTTPVAQKSVEQRRTEAVASMMNRRNLPRGRAAVG